jgi:hypothetical protein
LAKSGWAKYDRIVRVWPVGPETELCLTWTSERPVSGKPAQSRERNTCSPRLVTNTTSPSITQTNSSSAVCQCRWLVHRAGGTWVRFTPNCVRPAATPSFQRKEALGRNRVVPRGADRRASCTALRAWCRTGAWPSAGRRDRLPESGLPLGEEGGGRATLGDFAFAHLRSQISHLRCWVQRRMLCGCWRGYATKSRAMWEVCDQETVMGELQGRPGRQPRLRKPSFVFLSFRHVVSSTDRARRNSGSRFRRG